MRELVLVLVGMLTTGVGFAIGWHARKVYVRHKMKAMSFRLAKRINENFTAKLFQPSPFPFVEPRLTPDTYRPQEEGGGDEV